jgi:hypothetical protein
LSQQYKREGKNVAFIEHHNDRGSTVRKDRWRAAYSAKPKPGSLLLPLQLVDSGFDYSFSRVEFDREYKSMVDRALQQPPLVDIDAYFQVDRRDVNIQATVTNLADAPLSSVYQATVHAMIYEERHVVHTGRYVHVHKYELMREELPQGKSQTFEFTFNNIALNWSKSHVLILVDWVAPGKSYYESLNAAHAEEGQQPEPTATNTVDIPDPTETFTPTPETPTAPPTEPTEPTEETPTATDEPEDYPVYLPILVKNHDFDA